MGVGVGLGGEGRGGGCCAHVSCICSEVYLIIRQRIKSHFTHANINFRDNSAHGLEARVVVMQQLLTEHPTNEHLCKLNDELQLSSKVCCECGTVLIALQSAHEIAKSPALSKALKEISRAVNRLSNHK